MRSGLRLVKCKRAAPGRSAGGTWLQASSSCGSKTNRTTDPGHGIIRGNTFEAQLQAATVSVKVVTAQFLVTLAPLISSPVGHIVYCNPQYKNLTKACQL